MDVAAQPGQLRQHPLPLLVPHRSTPSRQAPQFDLSPLCLRGSHLKQGTLRGAFGHSGVTHWWGNQQLAALMTDAGFLDRSGAIGRKRFARAVTDAATHCRTDDDDLW